MNNGAISNWNSGFWGGAVGTLLSPFANTDDYYLNVATNAGISGTTSWLTGGKFSNGAILGAFRYMFNEWYHPKKDENGQPSYNISEKVKFTSKYNKRLHIDDSKRIYGKYGSWYQRYKSDGTPMEGWGGQIDFLSRSKGPIDQRMINFLKNGGDQLGFILSGASILTSGGTSVAFGVLGIGIDFIQKDSTGMKWGFSSLFIKPLAIGDFTYGTLQLNQ